MKIYTKIVIDSKTDEVLSEESFEYSGEVSYCGGGGTNGYDAKYNRRMADIAERTAEMSEEAFDAWNIGGGRALEEAEYGAAQGLIPFQSAFEQAQLESSTGLLPFQTALEEERIGTGTAQTGFEREQIAAGSELLPFQTQLQRQQIGAESSLIPSRTEYEKSNIQFGMDKNKYKSDLMNKFYASIGKNTEASAVGKARADVSSAISSSKSTAVRDAQKRGVAPPTGGFGLEGAKLKVGAISGAREGVRRENLSEYETGLRL